MKYFVSALIFLTFFVMLSSAQGSEEDSEIQTTSKGVKYIVHPSKLLSGGPPPDGIPSIDNPVFITVSEADDWLGDDDLVVVYKKGDTIRVYPFQILVWHEIVNDTVEGDPVLITYCPLCGSAIAYDRKLDGMAVEFGTSGMLYNSNLVMYDRNTNTYWSQIGGKAIVGPLTGSQLTPVAINTVFWGDWKDSHPTAEVLGKDTGFIRQYGYDPYESYYTDGWLGFPVENRDDRIQLKEVIYGIEINGVHKAYREIDLRRQKVINDKISGVAIQIEFARSGEVLFRRLDTGEEIAKERDFWFAWVAFFPDTLLFTDGIAE